MTASIFGFAYAELPVGSPACRRALGAGGLVFIEDANRDSDGAAFLRDAGLRFSAAAPLLNPDGRAVGTLWVGDVESRSLDPAQERALLHLARLAAGLLARVGADGRLPAIPRSLPHPAASDSDLGFAVIDISSGLIEVSEGWLEQFGFGSDASDLPPTFWLGRIHPEDRRRVEWVLDSLLIAHTPQAHLECRLRGGDEHWHWLSFWGRLECGPSGEPVRLHICLRNTTQENAYREQLRQLAQRAERELEVDRATLGRELHDELGQWLTAIRMDADRLLTLHRRGSALSAAEISERLAEIKQIAGDSIKVVQRFCQELRPSASAELGLASAVRGAADAFEVRTGIRCRVETPEVSQSLDPERCRVLFRALHEALTNVIRHAHASEVRITLREEGGTLELQIADNGRGLPPGALRAPSSIGLFGLRERAQGLGGEAIIDSVPNGGTIVTIRVSIQPDGGENQMACA